VKPVPKNAPLFKWADIETRGAVRIKHDGQDILIVRAGETAHAYLDQCPHNMASLDGGEGGDNFLTREKDALLCRWHGAMFRLKDGFCFAGPCAGKALTPVRVELRGSHIVLIE
jgi:nitrite reductase/ring-hydroxylating ferredoxin subunit